MAKINVKDTEITIISVQERDYISLTDMANAKESESRAADIIKNWLRGRYTLEFLGTWEQINNPGFKVVEFDHFKSQAGLPGFVLSVSEWIKKLLCSIIGSFWKHNAIHQPFGKPRAICQEGMHAVVMIFVFRKI